MLAFDVEATPLALEVYRTILAAGGHPMARPNEEDFGKIFYQAASIKQLQFFPKKYSKTLVDTIDHRIYIMADRNPLLLSGIDPKKIMLANKSRVIMRKWMDDKEDAGKLTWTLALYGTPGLAKQAGISLDDYWQQIINACFLQQEHPIKKWQSVVADIEKIKIQLNKLPIKTLHVKSKDTDLTILYGEYRRFLGGSGRNIPSFELFTSPDWRGTNGKVYFDYPLYRYGNLITGIHLEFKNGKVIKSSATKNEKLLKEMIKQKNADKIGEFSLTDIRHSHITAFMAHTLYDENFGGKFGNSHLALGTSYHDAYAGDAKKLNDADWEKLGFNKSAEHCDIIMTNDRVVTATLNNGVKTIIYKGGKFTV